jgi:hypothetical protein
MRSLSPTFPYAFLPIFDTLVSGTVQMPTLAAQYQDDKPDSARTPHLLCGSHFWPLSASLGCLYLAWLSYSHLTSHQVAWPADVWSILAYAVWVLFLLFLISETHCLRERLLFTIFIANFALALGMAATPATPAAAAIARQVSLALWILGAIYSISFIMRPIPAKSQKA